MYEQFHSYKSILMVFCSQIKLSNPMRKKYTFVEESLALDAYGLASNSSWQSTFYYIIFQYAIKIIIFYGVLNDQLLFG